ncbi:hypothetical protein A3Q56_02505 [Intoshia linei]|uniref:Uncharacterized protein n=1 Tax=Intoshia linei TaxID=1819745 RepID=A0A177B7L1_9BILA|nr:hypothetical protein A3Q56_02505 [Intoshia linei]
MRVNRSQGLNASVSGFFNDSSLKVEKSDTECLKLIKFVKEAAIPDPISIEDFLKIDYDENEAILSEIEESPKDTVDQLKTIKEDVNKKEESIPEKVSEEEFLNGYSNDKTLFKSIK